MSHVKAFGQFWWDFIVGDDVLLAIGVVGGLAATAVLVAIGVNAWWALPLIAVAALTISVRRAARRR
jgi:hypothetical protein